MKDELLTSLAIRRMREGGEQVVQQAMMYIERIGSVYWRCRILIELGRLLPLDAGLALDAEVAVLARKIPDDVQYEVSEAVLDVAIRVGERHREDLARLALEYHDLEPHPRWIARIL